MVRQPVVSLGLLIMTATAWALDPVAGSRDVPVSPASPLWPQSDGTDPCSSGTLTSPLTLIDAVGRTLCENAKTRVAWATIKLKAAAVRIAKENYLPALSGKAQELDSDTQTRLTHESFLDTSANDVYPTASLSLSWVLFDFGQRADQLESARQLLAAARANLDVNLQQVFLQAAADYYDTQAAQSSLESSEQIEDFAHKSVSAAHFRVEHGVAPVSDELQARTAYAQAVVNRVKAEAQLKTKRGALAVDMGMDPDSTISLPLAAADTEEHGDFVGSLHQLIEEAKRSHPSVAVAERELASAKADEKAVRVHGYPTVSVVGGLSRSKQSLAPSLGSPSVPGSVSNKSIGIEIDIPISDPLWRRGLIAQAHAQVEVQQETLHQAEQQVAQDVWNTYTALQADTDNLSTSQTLLASAEQSFQSTQHRYEGGVGNILELLSSQAAYASAEQQRIQALSDWRFARLALSASLGKLGLWAVESGPSE